MNINLIKKAVLTDSGKNVVYNFVVSQHKKGVIAFIIQKPGTFAIEKEGGVYVCSAERFINDFIGNLVFEQIKGKIDFTSLDAGAINSIFGDEIQAIKYSVNGSAMVMDGNGQTKELSKNETKQIFLNFIQELFEKME